MYLFSRSTRLAGGHGRDAMEWAVAMTERVNSSTDLGVALYAHAYSPGFGTIAWSAFVPDLATMEAATEKLLADDGYVKAANKGASYSEGGVDDSLIQLIHGEPDPSRNVQYVTTVQTVCVGGGYTRGVTLGVEIAQRAESVTGLPTMFGMNVTGPYGAVGWITGYESIQAMEAAQQALAASSEWAEFVDREVAGVYSDEAAASAQIIWRHIA